MLIQFLTIFTNVSRDLSLEIGDQILMYVGEYNPNQSRTFYK